MSKKLLSVLLSLCILLSALFSLPMVASAKKTDYTPVSGQYLNYEYRTLSDTTAEITKFNSSSYSVTIPSELEGYTITKIGDNAFAKCDNLESVIIPDTVEIIGYEAFEYCTSLTNVSIPNSVLEIEGGAFEYCTSLIRIDIPISVQVIRGCAFQHCTSLENIKFPILLKRVLPGAFDDTAWYNKQPNGVVYIGSIAYSYKGNCPKTLEVRSGTRSIEARAFTENCEDAETVILHDGLKTIHSNAFEWCTSLKTINIPDSVEKIEYAVFHGCTSLEEITLPASLSVISGLLFQDCESLKTVTIPDSVTTIEEDAFTNCPELKSLIIPASVTKIENYAFGYDEDLNYKHTKRNDFTVYGYTGTEAEKYAKTNGFPFVALDQTPTEPTTAEPTTAEPTTVEPTTAEPTTAPAPAVKVGDVNGDSTVNGADAGVLSRYASGWTGYADKIKNWSAADVNNDGNVNGADAGILSRHVSGWTQYAKFFS